jgi:hypothetical protein
MAREAHGFEQLVEVLDQKGVVEGGCELDVPNVAGAEVAVEAASNTTKGLVKGDYSERGSNGDTPKALS